LAVLLKSGLPSGESSSSPGACYIQAMYSPKFFFAFFWFSHRTGGGEANA
jgi:hypothetical protein